MRDQVRGVRRFWCRTCGDRDMHFTVYVDISGVGEDAVRAVVLCCASCGAAFTEKDRLGLATCGWLPEAVQDAIQRGREDDPGTELPVAA